MRLGGGGGVDMTHAPVFLDTTSEPVQKAVKKTVTEVVRRVLSAAGPSELTGEAIYDGIFNHPRLTTFRDKHQQSSASEKVNTENELLIDRLADAITKLKKMSNTLEQWHAYQSILTAIAPDLEEDTETVTKYNAMLKRRFKIWPAVAQKAAARRQAIDLEEIDAPWFQAKKKEYSNKLSRKYPDAFKQAEAVWSDETQVSANENDIEEHHDFSPGTWYIY